MDDTAFIRYLAGKTTVDDRALNGHVWRTLGETLAAMQGPLNVVEFGAGIGTMAARLVADGTLLLPASYTLVDENAALLGEARKRLADVGLATHFDAADALTFASMPNKAGAYDVMVAHAFLDLLPLDMALPPLLNLLKPGGVFYFSVTFDGVTAFEPVTDATLDARIEQLYHADMDARRYAGKPTAGSRGGRRLLAALQRLGVPLLAAGSSDWVVVPQDEGYPGDEAAFLHFIVDTVAGALHKHPALDAAAFARWVTTRHAQIDAGELTYIAHQLDVLGRAPR